MRRILILLAVLMLTFSAQAERLSDSQLMTYYDDSTFIGDSIMDMFRGYTYRRRQTEPDFLRGARFFCATSYRLKSASFDFVRGGQNVNLTYNGKPSNLFQIVEGQKPEKLLILLGVNDYIGADIPTGMGYVEKIISRVEELSPDTQIHFLSLTPVTRKFSGIYGYQAKWDAYNLALRQKCEELGACYVDIAERLKDAEGYLASANTSDQEYHLSTQGNDLVVESLLDFAQTQYEAGTWMPEAETEGIWLVFRDWQTQPPPNH